MSLSELKQLESAAAQHLEWSSADIAAASRTDILTALQAKAVSTPSTPIPMSRASAGISTAMVVVASPSGPVAAPTMATLTELSAAVLAKQTLCESACEEDKTTIAASIDADQTAIAQIYTQLYTTRVEVEHSLQSKRSMLVLCTNMGAAERARVELDIDRLEEQSRSVDIWLPRY